MANNLLSEKELENYAKILVWGLSKARKKPIEKNSFIEIKYSHEAEPLAEKLYSYLLEMNINPLPKQLKGPAMEKIFYSRSNDEQLMAIQPGLNEYFSNIAGSITLIAPSSLTHLLDVKSENINKYLKSRSEIKNILSAREEQGDYSWTLCIYPTKALADAAGMTIENYADKISEACFLKEKNPVELWEKLSKKSSILKSRLMALEIDSFHIESENTDLIIKNGKKRKWLGISGRNIPSFEIFISPDYRETSGIYYADQPSYRNGNIVESVKLEFKKGEVISASAMKGENYLKKTISVDKGASRIGEFSMTDKNFSKINSFMANTLYDENYGGQWGNIHIALGSSYSNSYSGDAKDLNNLEKKNLGFNTSAIHWDLVNTEKKIVTATLKNGRKQIIYKNGEFIL